MTLKAGSGTKSGGREEACVRGCLRSRFWAVGLVLTCVCQPVSVPALHFLPRGWGTEGQCPLPMFTHPPAAPPHPLSQNSPPPPLGNTFSDHHQHYDHHGHQHSQQGGHKVGHFWNGIGRGGEGDTCFWCLVVILKVLHPPKSLVVTGNSSRGLLPQGLQVLSTTPSARNSFRFWAHSSPVPFRGVFIQLVPGVQGSISTSTSQRRILE